MTDNRTTGARERNPGFDGMDARQSGQPVDACPYSGPGPQRTAWIVGWYLVEREEARNAKS